MGNTKRQHFIAGLGDGNVRKPRRTHTDDFFPPEQKEPYIRSGRTQKALRNARDIFHPEHFSGSGDGITSTQVSEGPWQISAMALLCVMGLLVGLFLHLVTDSSEKQGYPRRVRQKKTPPTKKKKKTDEWSEDEHVDEDEYTADNESLYYPYHPRFPAHQQQHRHRGAKSSSNSGTLFHRTPATSSAARHNAGSSHSPGPALRPTRSIDSGSVMSSSRGTHAVLEGVPSTDEDTTLLKSPWRQQSTLNARPLSPVSSFASSMGTAPATHSGDEELGTPPLVLKSASFDLHHQSSSLQVMGGGSDHTAKTPIAGSRRPTSDIFVNKASSSKSPYQSSTMLPPPPEHEPLQQDDFARAKAPIMLPYIPDLHLDDGETMLPPPPQSPAQIQPEEQDDPHVLRHSLSEPAAAVYPGHLREASPPEIQRQASMPEETSNNARKNIIHKRPDITLCTDAESSLMGSVDFAELSLDCVIGGGGFGQVWKATWRSTPVAVKVLTGSAQREIVSKGILEEFAAEINMLKGMRHPNICLYMGACLKPPNRAIITELASNGSLWDALRLPLSVPFTASDGTTRTAWPLSLYSDSSHPAGLPANAFSQPPFPPRGTWPWMLVKRVACGAARGMTYLHAGTPPVLHRDLKSANLLLDDSYTCKVCDFGLSRLKAQERSMTGNCGTVQWMAPEILSNQHYAEPADVYSFGIILWEMLTGECPYEGMSAIQCALSVLNRDQRPEIPAWCPPAFAALIRACWAKEPFQRPTFPQILLALDAMP